MYKVLIFKEESCQMYPYGYYQVPQVQYDYNMYDPYAQQDLLDPDRQPQQLERRVSRLERQVEQQQREINQVTRRLQRVNQRLRQVERRFNFPFTPFDGEF
jgi:predicted ribosome quality control (RQC) complex YloA/Tae2 family protein